jgi:two-component system, NtrC family, sensor kinase
MTATQDEVIAELQRANAELRRERDAALVKQAELAKALTQRNSEYGERIAHQSATIDVLRAMSASPGDPQPVFDLMVEHARSFCGADTSGIALAIDGTLYLRAHRGFSGNHASAYEASFPRPVSNDTNFGRTILARAVQQIPDNSIDPSFALATAARSAGVQSHAGVPLLRGGEPIGSLSIARKAPGNFTRTQMELLEIFAEQAVIAISSAEAYRAQKEALEQQTATAEVLQVINSFPLTLRRCSMQYWKRRTPCAEP